MTSTFSTESVRRLSNPLRTRLKAAVGRVVRRQVDALRDELKQERAAAAQALVDVHRGLGTLNADIEALAEATDTLMRDRELLNDALSKQNADHADLAQILGEFLATRHSGEELAKLRDDVKLLENRSDGRVRELSTQIDTFRSSVEMLLGPSGRYHSRVIDEQEVRALVAEFEFVGDDDRVATAVHHAYRTLVEVELRGIGRLSGSTENLLAKLAAVLLLDIPSHEVLEIGTLFGMGAVSVARQLSARDIDAFVTMVDPLAAYQAQPDRGAEQDVSHVPVTQPTVITNLRLGGVLPDRYRLVEGRSGETHVRSTISDRRYGLVIIDGDHSMETALEDLILAESLVEPGALVVLDDFGDPAWPGVAEALAAYEDRRDPTLRRVGIVSTTALIRAD